MLLAQVKPETLESTAVPPLTEAAPAKPSEG
jgi:hypothetical protein